MAKLYVRQQRGVLDATQIPAKKADGREVGAHKRVSLASKVTDAAWAVADTVVLAKKKAGEVITSIRCCTDTSFGTSTLSIGTAADPTKYVNARTLTTTDVPTLLGPKATSLDGGPGVEEELILTIGVANIAQATRATFEIETCGA